jgi:hypothetical protein
MEEDGVVILEDFLTPNEADELLAASEELEAQRPEDIKSTFGNKAQVTKRCTKYIKTNQNDPIETSFQHIDKYFLESNDKIRYFLETETNDGEKPRLNKVQILISV